MQRLEYLYKRTLKLDHKINEELSSLAANFKGASLTSTSLAATAAKVKAISISAN